MWYNLLIGEKTEIHKKGDVCCGNEYKLLQIYSARGYKKEIHMTGGKIEAKFTYPNGFVLETVITAGEITVKPSGILIDNEDGTYTIPEKVYPNPI